MKRILSLLLIVCALIALPGAAPQKKTAASKGSATKLIDVRRFPTEIWEEEPAVLGLCDDGTVRTAGLERFFDKKAVRRIQGWTDLVQIVSTSVSVAGLKSDGTVVYESFLNEDFSGLNPRYDPARWTNVVELIGGYEEIYGLTDEGMLMLRGDPADRPFGGDGHYLDWEGLRKVCFYSYPEERGLFALTDWGSIRRKNYYYRFHEIDSGLTESPMRVKDIDTSGYLFCCLLEDGRVLVTGVNAVSNEELVRGVESLRGVEQVSAGWSDVAVRYADGRVQVVGGYDFRTKDWRRIKEIYHAGVGTLLGLTEDGRVLMTGPEYRGPDAAEIASWRGVERLRCGEDYVLGWTDDGTLLASGIDLSQLR